MLQDLLMSKLIENTALGQKIQSANDISVKGRYVLDAIEKNPDVEGTIGEQIRQNSNNIDIMRQTVSSIVSLPDGASTAADGEIAAAKIGPKGESYTTLQESITQQIERYKGVAATNTEPDTQTTDIDIWIDTSNNTQSSSYIMPQINDTVVSTSDTWSSSKIDSRVEELADAIRDYISTGEFPEGGSGGTTGGGGSGNDYGLATENNDGLMSALNVIKLNTIEEYANFYSHPEYARRTIGMYKIIVDTTGHVSGATPVTKSDIMALGIPGQDTIVSYSEATSSSAGLMSASDKKKLDAEVWLPTQTLKAGETSITIESSALTDNSLLDIYYSTTDGLDVTYVQEVGSLGITIGEALEEDLIIKIKVMNVL